MSDSKIVDRLGSPSVGNVLGGSNLVIILALAALLRESAHQQDERAEETQKSVARVEVKVESLAARFDSVQVEMAAIKTQVEKLQKFGATAEQLAEVERRIDRIEECIRNRKRCRL